MCTCTLWAASLQSRLSAFCVKTQIYCVWLIYRKMSFIRHRLETLAVEALSLIHEAASEGGRVTMCQSRLLCPFIATKQKRCPQRSLPDAVWHRWWLQNGPRGPLRCERVGECVTLQSCCSLSRHISAHDAAAFFKMEYISTSDDQATLPHRDF